jgi:hypothetical protein
MNLKNSGGESVGCVDLVKHQHNKPKKYYVDEFKARYVGAIPNFPNFTLLSPLSLSLSSTSGQHSLSLGLEAAILSLL